MRIVNAENLEKNPIRALTAHHRTNADTYGFVNSQTVLSIFEAAGWKPKSQQAVMPRDKSRHGFQKHLVRLENPDFKEIPGLTGTNSVRPQLVFLNSHDKASSMRLSWGMFRLVCLNGLIMGQTMGEIRLNHSLNVVKRLPDAIVSMLQSFPKVIEQSSALTAKQLSPAAVNHLVKTVYDARLEHVKNIQSVDYRLPLLRREDDFSDAFTVLNRVQEVIIRGGIHYTYSRQSAKRGHDFLSAGTTRRVNGIDETVRLNQLAFDTALELV